MDDQSRFNKGNIMDFINTKLMDKAHIVQKKVPKWEWIYLAYMIDGLL